MSLFSNFVKKISISSEEVKETSLTQQGQQGHQGHQGQQGHQGHQGQQGQQGQQGHQGVDGLQGHQGHQGVDGLQGHQGHQGVDGLQGPPGPEPQPGPIFVSHFEEPISLQQNIDEKLNSIQIYRSGYYSLNCSVGLTVNGHINVYKNGELYKKIPSLFVSNNQFLASINTIIYLNNGELLDLCINVYENASIIPEYTTFACFHIRS